MLSGRTEASGGKTSGNSSEAFDRIKALDLTEGDEDLLRELIGLFKEECNELMERLRISIAAGDCDSVRKAAHRLKGASASVGGTQIEANARKLETMGATRTLADADSVFGELAGLLAEYSKATTIWFGEEKGQDDTRS
jgi:HPt (histidine-containing phosphotransfer) domain-containing protein